MDRAGISGLGHQTAKPDAFVSYGHNDRYLGAVAFEPRLGEVMVEAGGS